MTPRNVLLAVAFAMVALFGCAKKASYGWSDDYGGDGYVSDVVTASKSASMGGGARRGVTRGGPPAPPPPQADPAEMEEDYFEEEPEPNDGDGAARLVHYNGWCSIRATRVDTLLDDVADLAREVEGFVEKLGRDHVTIRVPVEDFDATWEKVLELGELVDHSLTAEDVTESFQAMDLRLKTARTTRDRLNALLAKANEEEEKIALLKQIQRLSEEIDRYESQLRVLGELASYSRITVQGIASSAFSGDDPGNDVAGFGWIRSLSPWRRDVTASAKLLKLDVPDGLVALDEKKRFIAESPDGTRIWSGRLLNEPKGNTEFWVAAIQDRIAKEFADAETAWVGSYQVLRLVDPAEPDGYRYLVGVKVNGKNLDMIQIYYPDKAQEERYKIAIEASLKGGDA